jgi:hypothetical protein
VFIPEIFFEIIERGLFAIIVIIVTNVIFLTSFLNIFLQVMRFEKKQKKSIFTPPSATDDYIFCCCGKRQDNENRAGRVGKMVTQWHCSGCTSVRGKGLLHQKCIEGVEKLRQARAALKAARTLEREYSERVSNPLRMAKTGEVHTPFVVLRLIVLTRKSNDLEPQNPS